MSQQTPDRTHHVMVNCGIQQKGLDDTTNTTKVNLSVTILAGVLLISLTHKNHKTFLSVFETDIIKKAFSMSAASTTLRDQNRIKMSKIFWADMETIIQ